MKKILFFLTAFLLLATFINTKAQPINDWSWSHPRVTGQTMRWCQMFDANTWYAVGYGGNFFKTTNAGATWTHRALYNPEQGDNVSLYDAHFFNMNTGVVAAYKHIFKTTDGGNTWNAAIVVPPQTSSWYKLSFINNTTGFVAGYGGKVYRTLDGGNTWGDISTSCTFTSYFYSVAAVSSSIIMAGESTGDIWRTTNAGASWTEILNSGGTVYDIEFLNSTTGFATGSSTMCLKTTNAGANWTAFPTTGVPSSSFYDVDFAAGAPPKLFQDFASTTFPPTGWTETGTTSIWSRQTASGYGVGVGSMRAYFYGISSGTGIVTTSTFAPTSAGESLSFDHAYANYSSPADDSLHIQSSTNGGSTWTTVLRVRCGTSLQTAPNTSGSFTPTASQWATKTYVLPTGTNRLRFNGRTDYGNNLFLDNIQAGGSDPMLYLTGNAFAIWKSPITAPSWDSLGHYDAATQVYVSTMYSTSLAANGDSLLTVGGIGLINKRNNISNRLCFRTWPYWSNNVSGIGVIGNRIMATTEGYYALLVSTNGGTTWDTSKTIPGTSSSYDLNDISTFGNNAWVCGYSGKVIKSTNGGVNWAEIADVGSYELMDVDFVNALTGWVVGYSGRCYKTTNGGTNFTQQTVTGQTSTIYGISMANATTGWNVGYGGKVYKTTNGGTNWVAQTSNFTSYLRGIDMVSATTGFMVGYSACVRKTTNGGTNWDSVSMPYTYGSFYAVDFVDQWNGMVVGSSGITYRTRDGGTTWIFENTGGSSMYSVKMTSTDSGWAGSYQYIFKYAETLTGGNTYSHNVPTKYELSQNYPNPFNPTTTIQFGLPKAGRVSLKIYDVSGRLVRTLVNNEGLNEGTFKYIFNGSDIASGVYFYSLVVSGNIIDTKKMVLIK